MEKNKELGQLLKQHREKAFEGMGLRRVATEVGIDYAHLFRIEAGQYIPSDESLLKMMNAYSITTAEQLNLFNLARLSPGHREIIDQVLKVSNDKTFAAFYRRKSEEEDKK
jgi:transcriptional regulator with XRE-family HTH domain